ncbi:hypothetical protein [Actinoplanes sp. NPDC048796]|uniref:hypothetical protein n=1 Tax=Actinoplanes sp. NPDC048796 TaxID=3155640 RepID=UPI0033D446B6
MTDEARPGPKRYRVRAYDNDYEVLADKVHLEWLDLDAYGGFKEARTSLEALRRSLAFLVGVKDGDLPTFRLAVHTWPDGQYVMDWVGR